MKTPILKPLATLGLSFALLLGGATASIAATHQPITATGQNLAATGLDDFSFDSFDSVFELSLDNKNRAVLLTTETLVARFPEYDQNHGIRRSIPESYLGKDTHVNVISVTDENGAVRPFETSSDGTFMDVVSRAPDDAYVHGLQTYVITYRQFDVIGDFSKTTKFDEFYWDINGDGWAQPFGRVTATVNLDAKLARILHPDQISCYQGVKDSSAPCSDKQFVSAQEPIVFTANNLEANQTLTIALPFTYGTVSHADPAYFDHPGSWLQLAAALGIFGVLAWGLMFRLRRLKNAEGRPFIIAEYKAPTEPSLPEIAILTHHSQRWIAATITWLAVNGYLTINHIEESRSWMLERTERSATDVKVQEQLAALFDAGAPVVRLDKHRSTQMQRLNAALTSYFRAKTSALNKSPYFRQTTWGSRLVAMLAGTFFAILAIGGGGWLGTDGYGDQYVPLALFFCFLTFVTFLILVSKRPLTAPAAEIRDHIKGLELYIHLAEADRLKFLQSPQGALREGTVLKVYEGLLPWAVMLGEEKEWSKVLQVYYQDETPAWMVGASVGAFGASFNDFSSFTQTSLAAAAASTSGGSGGGGGAGGGGGGGGGGGV